MPYTQDGAIINIIYFSDIDLHSKWASRNVVEVITKVSKEAQAKGLQITFMKNDSQYHFIGI